MNEQTQNLPYDVILNLQSQLNASTRSNEVMNRLIQGISEKLRIKSADSVQDFEKALMSKIDSLLALEEAAQ